MLFDYCPPMRPLDIIYRDTQMIALNKPAGLLAVPGRQSHMKDCLSARVQEKFPAATVVHRLDMDTSGIMVMALTKAAHRHIAKQFEKRAAEKSYLAHLYGSLAAEEGEINLPLILDWENRPLHIVDHDKGKPALTRWKILKRGKDFTVVEFTPLTGRTHQLRVHSRAIGHPILGDSLYAHDAARALAGRLMLHAQALTLIHPLNREKITFSCPADF